MYLVDSAQRWIYVGNATGLVKNERERNVITCICTLWDSLIWNPGNEPNLHHVRFQCGSHGGLFKMMLEVLYETFGDFRVHIAHDVNNYHNQMEAGKVAIKPEAKHILCGEDCLNLQAFLKTHYDEVELLRSKFLSLRDEIQMELALWFLSRSKHNHVFTDLNIVPFHSKYYDAVYWAHTDYGKLNYPKKSRMCEHCGVLNDE